jgi:phenylalanyl-tRNA synthetase alpha subunit
MKIKIDMSELKQTLDNCIKDAEQLSKMIKEFNQKYPFVELTAKIDVDYQKTLVGIKYEVVTEVTTTDMKDFFDKVIKEIRKNRRYNDV